MTFLKITNNYSHFYFYFFIIVLKNVVKLSNIPLKKKKIKNYNFYGTKKEKEKSAFKCAVNLP